MKKKITLLFTFITACPPGTYKDNQILGDESTCKKCPDENQSTALGATHVSQCSCKKGFRTFNGTGCSGKANHTLFVLVNFPTYFCMEKNISYMVICCSASLSRVEETCQWLLRERLL